MKINLFSAFILASISLLMAQCQAHTPGMPEPQKQPAPVTETPEKRGEYLVSILGCDDCHTPKSMTPTGPAPDMRRRFMGHPADELFIADAGLKTLIETKHVGIFSPGTTAAAGPWGTSYAANITPDDTGIGAWTEAQFVKAMREGKSKGLDGARPILPPMPVASFGKMTDDDLKAIYVYLNTLSPIRNVVPQPRLL